MAQSTMAGWAFLLVLTILLPKVFAQSISDETGTLVAVVLVCAVVFIAVVIFWIIFCYYICKISYNYRTARKREAALRRREERVRKQQQQHDVHARRKYSQFTGTQNPPRREVPGTPRLDHPRFQPTFLREVVMSPSMEFHQGRNRESSPTPATPSGVTPRNLYPSHAYPRPHVTFSEEIVPPQHEDGSHSNFTLQGGLRIPHSRSFEWGSRTPNQSQSASDCRLHSPSQHQTRTPAVQTPVTRNPPSHMQLLPPGSQRGQQRWLHQSVTQRSDVSPQPSTVTPLGRYNVGQHSVFQQQAAHSLQGEIHVGHRLRSVRELEEIDVWPESEEEEEGEPPRYSHLFAVHEHQQHDMTRPYDGYYTGIPSRQPQAMPFHFSPHPPPTHPSRPKGQSAHKQKQPLWSWNRHPNSHKTDMTQFNQLSSWPQFN